MKRIIALLLITVTAMLCSCTETQNANLNKSYNPDTDVPYFYRLGDGGNPIAKSPDGYYFVGDFGVVVYMDKSTMKATPLCNKPNCNHTDKDTCGAFIAKGNASGSNIQYYEKYLYTINTRYNSDKQYDEPFLARYNPDGTGFKQITDPINTGDVGELDDWFIHRGYFYYSTMYGIYRLPMNEPKKKVETVFEAKKPEEESNNIHAMNAYGEYLYFEAFELNDDDNLDSHSYVLNLKTQELNTLKDEVAGFYNDKLITVEGNPDENKMYYKACGLDGSNTEEFETLKYGKVLRFDPERKLMYSFDNDNKAAYPSVLTAYDSSGKELYSTALPKDFSACETPQDESFFFEFIRDGDDEDSGKQYLYYASKDNVGKTLKLKKLCKLSWAKIVLPGYITVE